MSIEDVFKGRTVNFDLVDDWEARGIKIGFIYCSTCTTYRNRVMKKDEQFFGKFTCKDHK